MSQHRRFDPPITVIVNTMVCGIIGAAIGSFWNFWLWLAASLAFGALVGYLSERFFVSLQKHVRIYRMRLVMLVLVEMLLTIYVLIPAVQAYINLHPGRVPVTSTQVGIGMNYESVTLVTQDGVTLKGWYLPSHNGAAVIGLHGFGGNRMQVLPQAQALVEQGYGVLLIDLRAQGESGDASFCGGWNGDLDVQPAVTYLKNRREVDPQRIGGFGLSAGGYVLIHAAARISDIKAVIVDGVEAGQVEDYLDPLPPEYRQFWFMTPIPWMTDRMIELASGVTAAPPLKEEVMRIAPRPIFFISSGIGVEQFQTRKFFDWAASTSEIWELPEVGHCAGFVAYPEEYSRRILAFMTAFSWENR